MVVFAMSGKARRFSPTLSKYMCQSIEIDFRGNKCEKAITEFHTFHQTESKKGMSTQKSNQLHEKRCKAKYVIVYRETGQVTMNFPWIHKSQDIQESCQFKHAIHRCFKKKISLVSKCTH